MSNFWLTKVHQKRIMNISGIYFKPSSKKKSLKDSINFNNLTDWSIRKGQQGFESKNLKWKF